MRLRSVALTMLLGLGAAGLVSADDTKSGSWWPRPLTMPWSKSADAKKADAKKNEPPPGPTARERQSIAEAALQRRREVCLRLQEIGIRVGDESLIRRAEELDQRAWDAHVAALARIRQPASVWDEPDTKKKEKRK